MEENGANIPPIKIYPYKFAEQVVVVTGAAQGIGEAAARLFAAQGAIVILVDLNENKLKELTAKMNSEGAKVYGLVCHVGIETEVDSLINQVAARHGRIDILVHLAGIYPANPILCHATTEYRRTMNVNMDSCFFLTRAVLPHMQKAGYGRIINTASGSIQSPVPGLSVYVAAKSAIVGFTRVTAVEAGPGITANVVSPGLTKTNTMWTAGTAADGSRPLFDQQIARQCVKRHGQAEDIAHTICFIASPEAQFTTGQLFDVGGGATFH